jgi:hypothetical protein
MNAKKFMNGKEALTLYQCFPNCFYCKFCQFGKGNFDSLEKEILTVWKGNFDSLERKF